MSATGSGDPRAIAYAKVQRALAGFEDDFCLIGNITTRELRALLATILPTPTPDAPAPQGAFPDEAEAFNALRQMEFIARGEGYCGSFDAIAAVGCWLADARAELATTAARLAAAEADAKRLDWLECNALKVLVIDPESDASVWILRYMTENDHTNERDGATVREAIDKAMAHTSDRPAPATGGA